MKRQESVVQEVLDTAEGSGTRTAYKRDPTHRVFVNRSLQLERIKFFGFDMDYTLAIYKSPDYESLVFSRVIDRLISIGYPNELRKFNTYEQSFPVRGLWFDQLYGNLLKVDGFGNILVGVHGFHFMKPSEIENRYPNKFVHLIDSRICVLNTLFDLPVTYLLACIVNFFDTAPDYKRTDDSTGVMAGEMVMSYKSIYQDVRAAVDWVHWDSELKDYTLKHVDTYIVRDDRIKQLLEQLRRNGATTFLLTNSGYKYTDGLMRYLLGDKWQSYFDITVVDAGKPKWFADGTVFRQVDTVTGALRIGIHTGPLKQAQVYSGGSCAAFGQLLKVRGKDVLYIGDHIFGDVLRSKKERGWRTFLVVPELSREVAVWTERWPLFEQLTRLDNVIGEIYKNLDSSARNKPAMDKVVQAIREVTHEWDQSYSKMGSLFRSGSRTTFFASQVERYADLYASSCCNLIYYPLFYFFRASAMLMPHESTVDHKSSINTVDTPIHVIHSYHQELKEEVVDGSGQLCLPVDMDSGTERASTPISNTFCHEENEEDGSSTPSSSSDPIAVASGGRRHLLSDSDVSESPPTLSSSLSKCNITMKHNHVDKE